MHALIIEDVVKRFGRVVAVDHLSMRVEPGEFVSLLGPSGCGKSTTLNMIAGLETIDEGNMYIDDVRLNNLQPKDRDVAMVFQNYALYPHMTIFDNIAFPLKARRTARTEMQRMVNSVANTLGLGHLLERLPRQLSGGQRQRVALARAIVRSPKLFLMDEPLSNLDAKLRIQMRAELRHLHLSLGTTTIYVTHDQAEAMTLSDRIAVMREGILQQFGPAREVYDRPNNIFVAGFLGSYPMAFIEGRLRDGDSPCLDAGKIRVPLSREKANALRSALSSDEVVLGVRPEHSQVSLAPAPDALAGQIYVVEQLGSDALVDVEVADTRFMVRTDPGFPGRVGDPAWLSFDPERMHFFDAKTERAV